jgi:hypothetical protein
LDLSSDSSRSIACVLAALIAAAGCTTEPREIAVDYDLVGTFDTVFSTSRDAHGVYTSTTVTTPTPTTGLLHFDTLEPVPSGTLFKPEDALETPQWFTVPGYTTRTGNDVSIVFAYVPTISSPNPKWVIAGTIAGDSIYGTIRYERSTSTTSKAWGHFVARRRR